MSKAARAWGKDDAEVVNETATFEQVEAPADLGVESQAHGVEKGQTVRRARVDGARPAVQERMEGAVAGSGNAEVAAEAVAGAAGNEAEHGVGLDEGLGHLVHRAVAPDGHDEVAAGVEGAPGQLGAVARPFGVGQGLAGEMAGEEGPRPLEHDGIPPVAAGVGIKDETGLQSSQLRKNPARGQSRRWRSSLGCHREARRRGPWRSI